MPSIELSNYLQLRADGVSAEGAAFESGIGLKEAELTEAAIASGEIELPRARARAREGMSIFDGSNEGGNLNMARDDVQTSIRVGNGPGLPINLDNIDDPANDEAKAAIAESVRRAINGDAETATAKKLKLYVERVERLDGEIKDLNEDKSGVFSEMKADGFDTKTVKTIIKLRKMDAHARQEAAALLETYARAVGLQHALPL